MSLGALNIDNPYDAAYGIYGYNSTGGRDPWAYQAPILPGLFPHRRELYNTDTLWDAGGYADRQPVRTLVDDVVRTALPQVTPEATTQTVAPVGPSETENAASNAQASFPTTGVVIAAIVIVALLARQ